MDAHGSQTKPTAQNDAKTNKKLSKEKTEKNKVNSISIINTAYECDQFVDKLHNNFTQYGFRAIGFDGEWISRRGGRSPVLLIQIALFDPSTDEVPCGLIRLCKLDCIPHSLKTLLEDPSVYKVGVATIEDAYNLQKDYSVSVRSALDLRFLAVTSDYEAGGIARLAEEVCGIVLKKDKTVQCGNWAVQKLSNKQIQYAADDARTAMRIFMGLLSHLLGFCINQYNIPDWSKITPICVPHLDQRFNDREYLNKICLRSVIIKNVPESTSSDINIQKDHDKNKVEQIIKSAAHISIDGLKVSRIFRKTNTPQARPIKVIFKSEKDASTVLENKDGVEKPFILGPDLLNKWVNAKIELRHRTKKGEKNLIIKDIHGMPTVVTKEIGRGNKKISTMVFTTKNKTD